MSWIDDVYLVPTENREMLDSLVGKRITALAHYLSESPADLLADPLRRLEEHELFAYGAGYLVLTVDGTSLQIGDSEELISLTIEPADLDWFEEDGWFGPIQATDTRYSDPEFASLVGSRIVGIRILQLAIENQLVFDRQFFFPKAVDRPREVALVLELDQGQLVFSTTLDRKVGNLAVSRQFPDTKLPLREILRVP